MGIASERRRIIHKMLSMSKAAFRDLWTRVQQTTVYKDCLCPQRAEPNIIWLVVTVRHLADGASVKVTADMYQVGEGSVNHVLRYYCLAVFEAVNAHISMSFPPKEDAEADEAQL
eukprot:m.85393 g.85393  ORF g.85393 m.85393 type:complete len:115 (-) comp12780_c0_seq1:2181-2525(-)